MNKPKSFERHRKPILFTFLGVALFLAGSFLPCLYPSFELLPLLMLCAPFVMLLAALYGLISAIIFLVVALKKKEQGTPTVIGVSLLLGFVVLTPVTVELHNYFPPVSTKGFDVRTGHTLRFITSDGKPAENLQIGYEVSHSRHGFYLDCPLGPCNGVPAFCDRYPFLSEKKTFLSDAAGEVALPVQHFSSKRKSDHSVHSVTRIDQIVVPGCPKPVRVRVTPTVVEQLPKGVTCWPDALVVWGEGAFSELPQIVTFRLTVNSKELAAKIQAARETCADQDAK